MSSRGKTFWNCWNNYFWLFHSGAGPDLQETGASSATHVSPRHAWMVARVWRCPRGTEWTSPAPADRASPTAAARRPLPMFVSPHRVATGAPVRLRPSRHTSAAACLDGQVTQNSSITAVVLNCGLHGTRTRVLIMYVRPCQMIGNSICKIRSYRKEIIIYTVAIRTSVALSLRCYISFV